MKHSTSLLSSVLSSQLSHRSRVGSALGLAPSVCRLTDSASHADASLDSDTSAADLMYFCAGEPQWGR
jgi:hypothetical protein